MPNARTTHWVVDGLPRSPLIERAFDRLDDLLAAPTRAHAVLNWGDARIGNVIYDGFEPAAVLDWEMAAVAPREVDLGWTVYLHRFFQDLTVSFGQPGLPDFLRRDADRAALCPNSPATRRATWTSTRCTPRCGTRSSCCASPTARRTSARSDLPADPDSLILHHGSLRGHGAGQLLGRERGAQAASRRISGTRIGREPGPPTCEKGCVRQSSP